MVLSERDAQFEFPGSAFEIAKPLPPELVPINGNFKGKDILSLAQFNRGDVKILFDRTEELKEIGQKGLPSNILAGKLVTLLFYEASSRTRGSFDAATKQLGGNTIVVEDPQHFSSVSKGETLEDTIQVFEAYTDAIVLRHADVGTAQIAADTATRVPIINAGDGIGEHPTQALLDLYTIFENTGRLSGLKGVMAGDIKNGRTVHSLLQGLSLFPGNEVFLLSPNELRLSPQDRKKVAKSGVKIHEIGSTDEIPPGCDFWYWTRVQKERIASAEEYERVNNRFVLTWDLLHEHAGLNTIIMHPLPRVGEIDKEVDNDSRAVYLRSQIRNGLYTRMALLSLVLGQQER